MDVGRKSRRPLGPDAVVGLGVSEAPERCCEWPGCAERGDFPAPRSPQALRAFLWLCLEHVRDYNRSWNYFAGMNEDEIEAHRRADFTWHRPSWRFGGVGAAGEAPFHDPFGFFADGGPGAGSRPEPTPPPGKPMRMMAVLDLEPGFTLVELKARYKTLVKRHHPDRHGGDRDAEERLKAINEAYTYLVDNRLHR
ncbi:MAG: J domain-containing protein [Geminicoccaceae bacterium]|jgi:hypothetical protein|nr:J domain-containing protein [Geminicoccaceae bacterium]MCB9966853.1 J domain-containing protein [Geminicoccaceae bacterium]